MSQTVAMLWHRHLRRTLVHAGYMATEKTE